LVYQGETVGQLILATRAPGEMFSPADQRLLDDLARQAGVAVHAVRLTSDLQRARERLVTAREEERRRLRRDLHDGLGPQLASQTLLIDTVFRLLPNDIDGAINLLQRLKSQSQDAIADIRRLVYALRPPALDDLGLVGALREHAMQYLQSGIQITVVAQELPPLPAAVEVAVYRIVQEALTNVIRHAQAHLCIIEIALGTELLVTIIDDGCGLPADRRMGVGLTSMQERAAELGGRLVIEPRFGGGTQVRAWLPLQI
jgi:signal transduction histidine kinase